MKKRDSNEIYKGNLDPEKMKKCVILIKELIAINEQEDLNYWIQSLLLVSALICRTEISYENYKILMHGATKNLNFIWEK